MAYFDTKSGSLEEAIRGAVRNKINEAKIILEEIILSKNKFCSFGLFVLFVFKYLFLNKLISSLLFIIKVFGIICSFELPYF